MKTKNSLTIYQSLIERGFTFTVQGDILYVAPMDQLTSEDQTLIRQHKPELMELLKSGGGGRGKAATESGQDPMTVSDAMPVPPRSRLMPPDPRNAPRPLSVGWQMGDQGAQLLLDFAPGAASFPPLATDPALDAGEAVAARSGAEAGLSLADATEVKIEPIPGILMPPLVMAGVDLSVESDAFSSVLSDTGTPCGSIELAQRPAAEPPEVEVITEAQIYVHRCGQTLDLQSQIHWTWRCAMCHVLVDVPEPAEAAEVEAEFESIRRESRSTQFQVLEGVSVEDLQRRNAANLVRMRRRDRAIYKRQSVARASAPPMQSGVRLPLPHETETIIVAPLSRVEVPTADKPPKDDLKW